MLAVACASSPEPGERTVLVRSASESVVLLPLNLAARMPEELEPWSPRLWEALIDYLRQRAPAVKTVAPTEARQLWLESVRKARETEHPARSAFDEAARLLVERIGEHAEFGAVVLPTLFIQTAEISEGAAHWDDTSAALFGDSELEFQYEGQLPAASLHVVIFDANGDPIQQTQTGIELLVQVVNREATREQPTMVPRRELFSDPAVLRERVSRALGPFLPAAPETVTETGE